MQDMVQNANAKPATGLVSGNQRERHEEGADEERTRWRPKSRGMMCGSAPFGASGVFGQLQTSLNAIWGVQPLTPLPAPLAPDNSPTLTKGWQPTQPHCLCMLRHSNRIVGRSHVRAESIRINLGELRSENWSKI